VPERFELVNEALGDSPMPASNMLPLVTHHRLRRILRYGPYVLLLPTVALQVAGVDTSANFLILTAGACWLGFSLFIWVSAHVISVAPAVAGTVAANPTDTTGTCPARSPGCRGLVRGPANGRDTRRRPARLG
jgi:hypothetical protein